MLVAAGRISRLVGRPGRLRNSAGRSARPSLRHCRAEPDLQSVKHGRVADGTVDMIQTARHQCHYHERFVRNGERTSHAMSAGRCETESRGIHLARGHASIARSTRKHPKNFAPAREYPTSGTCAESHTFFTDCARATALTGPVAARIVPWASS